MNDQLRKPYAAQDKTIRYPYAEEYFCKQSIFSVLTLDGGAFLLSNELLGMDWTAEKLETACCDESIYEHWKQDSVLHPEMAYEQYLDSHMDTPLEKYVWINRMYPLLAMAHQFCVTKNERWAKLWYAHLDSWNKSHPYIPIREKESALDFLIWRDMQVAWRLIILSHSVKLLESSVSLGHEAWHTVYDMIRQHAAHLLVEGALHVAQENAQNHVLQVGVALLFAGVCFPELCKRDKCIRTGREIIAINMRKSIYPDGGNNEDSCSYSHFIARLYAEGFLLLKKNGLEDIPGLEACIHNQINFLLHMADPSGNTLQIGDSYSMPALDDLRNLAGLLELRVPETARRSVFFPNSLCAHLRSGDFDVYCDGMPCSRQWHQHAGNPQVLVYFRDAPVMVDAGTCDYDNHSLHDFLMSDMAHNTIRIGTEEDSKQDHADDICCLSYDFSGDVSQIAYQIKGSRNGIGFIRIRRVKVSDAVCTMQDEIATTSPCPITAYLHLGPVEVKQIDGKFVMMIGGKDFFVRCEGAQSETLLYQTVIDKRNKFSYSPVLCAQARGQNVCFTVTFSAE